MHAEFLRQGDEERQRGLPVSAFMDRARPRLAQSQVNFIEFICLPLFQCVSEQTDRYEVVQQARANLEYWRRLARADDAACTDGAASSGPDCGGAAGAPSPAAPPPPAASAPSD